MNDQKAIESTTAQEYVAALHQRGAKAFLGKGRAFWVVSERFGLERHPETCFDVPSKEEIRSLLWHSGCLVANYVLPAEDASRANSILYFCDDCGYNLEKLSSTARRDARRALRAFRFEFLDPKVLLANGARAYCDTRARVGLSDGTPQIFQGYTASLAATPGFKFLGAWHGDQLAAYMWLQMVDDWVAIAAYAANDHLRSCPNNGLIHFALDYFLTQGRCREVIYGLSSIQEINHTASLGYFKKKVGFECRPVCREFVFHPLVKPFINPLADWIVRACLKFRPQSRILRKASGLLANSLGKTAPSAATAASQGREPSSEQRMDSEG